jgi:hypothetical protein
MKLSCKPIIFIALLLLIMSGIQLIQTEKFDKQVDLNIFVDDKIDNYWMLPPSRPLINYDINNPYLEDEAEHLIEQQDQYILPSTTKFRKAMRGVPCQSDFDCNPAFGYCSTTTGRCKYQKN